MTYKYDYIMNQIEKATQLIAALITSKKIEQRQEADINQTLAALTGLDIEHFAHEKNAAILHSLLGMIYDDNKKALAAKLLWLKNKELYHETCMSLFEQIDHAKLDPGVKKLTKDVLR